MNRYFLSLGSNIQPEKHIPYCVRFLKKTFLVTKVSTTYETPPIGPSGTQPFWNSIVEIQTSLEKETLVECLRGIEAKLGRQRDENNKYAPRTIDIDILPQTDFDKMAFIIVPLAEIAGEECFEEGKTFGELAAPLLEEAKSFKKVIDSELPS